MGRTALLSRPTHQMLWHHTPAQIADAMGFAVGAEFSAQSGISDFSHEKCTRVGQAKTRPGPNWECTMATTKPSSSGDWADVSQLLTPASSLTAQQIAHLGLKQ